MGREEAFKASATCPKWPRCLLWSQAPLLSSTDLLPHSSDLCTALKPAFKNNSAVQTVCRGSKQASCLTNCCRSALRDLYTALPPHVQCARPFLTHCIVLLCGKKNAKLFESTRKPHKINVESPNNMINLFPNTTLSNGKSFDQDFSQCNNIL